ncbi:MAG: MBL fold metallo-hydrolase [Boseongicola sp.]|nr:MAG: MBL fold metallo-hydrolase [Boseongicola sp.]
MKTMTMKTLAATSLLALGAGAGQADEPLAYTNEIAPGVYSFGGGNGYHSMFLVTDEGVVAIETINSAHSEKMIEAIKDVSDQPIKFALHSHNHWDHASGGGVFQAAGAETVMHTLAAQYIQANPGQDTSSPDIVWEGDRYDIEIGGLTVEHHYLGLNHGLGMTVYVVPEKRVAYIADLVTPDRIGFNIMPDFNIGEWERSLGEILELDFDVAVCSHTGLSAEEAPNGCTKTHVAEEKQFIGDLRGAIFAEFQNGTPADQIPATVELPQYAEWSGYDEWLEMNAGRVMLDIWMGPYPWIPES